MMASIRLAAKVTVRTCCEIAAGRRPRLAVAVPAALMLAMSIAITACGPGASYPVQAAYTPPGPYATTAGTVKDGSGKVIYDLFYPSNYAALGFKSPIVTWGNGTAGKPAMVSTFLDHLASYGFTVIASTSGWTGSGKQIDAAARYLAAQNSAAGSVFDGKLDVHEVAAVGLSQGAGGVVRAATNDPALITTVLTFSLPNTLWARPNPGCPTRADCLPNPAALTQPVFFISTHGPFDAVIASPATERAFYNGTTVHAALGIIRNSDGKRADHASIENTANGGNPGGELGYATAWLEYRLRGDATAAGAFTGAHPELVSNTNWPGSAAK
jgi:hypothetical protein